MTRLSPVAVRIVELAWADRVPSPAHDSLNPAERRAYLERHPDSFLAVDQTPDDLPETSVDDVLAGGRRALERLIDQGAFGAERPPYLYVHQLEQSRNGVVVHQQVGVVGGLAISRFDDGDLRPHELIHDERAAHLGEHLGAIGVQSSPVAVAVRPGSGLGPLLARCRSEAGPPLVEAHGGNGLTQRIWAVKSTARTGQLVALLAANSTYLIDGHHRAAAAASRREPWLLSAVFPAEELANRAFNRRIDGVNVRDVLALVGDRFAWREVDRADLDRRDEDEVALTDSGHPDVGPWVVLRLPLGDDVLDRLDPVRIDRHLLGSVLGIDASQTDPRIAYHPASAFTEPFERTSAAADQPSVLCIARPVSVETVLDLADAGRTLPPKSTYFEPKIPSGVFLHAARRS